MRGAGMRGAVLMAALASSALPALSGCSFSGPSTTGGASTSSVATTGSVSSTSSGSQVGGVRTVLSPGGLNIRAQPSKSAPIKGTAAQATELAVVAHTAQGGGWFEVKGSTTTGWISDNSMLSAPGTFAAYYSSDHQFGALYPDTWTVVELPPARVVFRPKSGSDTVVATTASTVGQLSRGRAGYHQSGDQPVVVCGITADLLTFTQVSTPSTSTPAPGGVAAGRYLVQVHFALDAQHALGIDANISDPSQFQPVRDFLSSVKFPFPQCQR